MRDESDRAGMRIVIELKREATPEVVLNQLFRFTQHADEFRHQHAGARRRPPAADGPEGRAEVLHPVPRGGRFSAAPASTSRKARDRAHLLVGLAIAVANIDEVIRLIRASPDAATARAALMDARLAGGRRRRRCWR